MGTDQTKANILDETDWVRIEIEAALNKKIPVIPVLIDRSQMPKPDELPDNLKRFAFRQAARIDTENFHSTMDKVIASIDKHFSPEPAPVKPTVAQNTPSFAIQSPRAAQQNSDRPQALSETQQSIWNLVLVFVRKGAFIFCGLVLFFFGLGMIIDQPDFGVIPGPSGSSLLMTVLGVILIICSVLCFLNALVDRLTQKAAHLLGIKSG